MSNVFDIDAGDVRIFTLITGMEILGKVSKVENEVYHVAGAFGIQLQPDINESGQQIGVRIGIGVLSAFAQNKSKTGSMDIILHESSIMSVNDPPEDLVTQYSTLTGSVIAPPSRKIQTALR